jgi:V8-like Glu-specific endopeptidase
MNLSLKIAALAILTVTSMNSFAGTVHGPRVIYGNDDRKDIYQVTNPLYLKLADSTVALVQSSNITQNSSGIMSISGETLMNVMGVCASEPFATQPSGAFCSGTLVGKSTILTAGHCITSQSECNTTKFVFGYDVDQAGNFPKSAKESEVYSCKSIMHREQNGSGADFGVIQLDREVSGHLPVKLSARTVSNPIANGSKLLMIGHPSGLPTKLDDGGIVRDGSTNGYFVATTDSYGGNSGSGVFNITTGEIEGVLVRGEQDFVQRGSCYVSNVCSATGCRGEDVTKASSIVSYIPAN